MKEIKIGNWSAIHEREYWDIFYNNRIVASGDDENGVRFDRLLEPNGAQTIWFSQKDLHDLLMLSQKIELS